VSGQGVPYTRNLPALFTNYSRHFADLFCTSTGNPPRLVHSRSATIRGISFARAVAPENLAAYDHSSCQAGRRHFTTKSHLTNTSLGVGASAPAATRLPIIGLGRPWASAQGAKRSSGNSFLPAESIYETSSNVPPSAIRASVPSRRAPRSLFPARACIHRKPPANRPRSRRSPGGCISGKRPPPWPR